MTNGPDAPINDESKDRLGRRSVAMEVFNIIKNSRSEWTVRIGIFGKWGSGKTSVMSLLEKIARSNDVPVVHFNPWSCTSEQEMWMKFSEDVFSDLKKQGITIAGENTIKAKILAAKSGGVVSAAAEANPIADVVVKGLNVLLSGKADLQKKDFNQIAQATAGKRIIVLVDDLDRTETTLIPRLFFGLHELLDLPGFSFVLGFDPDVVGKALGGQHPGWGNGLTFLEKIIDYPIWLPEPTDYQMKDFLAAELQEDCPELTLEDFLPVFDRLPRNPRTLKRFVRQIWRLREGLKRHNKEELNFPLLVVLNLFKSEWPIVYHHAFQHPEVMDRFLDAQRLGSFSKDPQRDAKLETSAREALANLLQRIQVDPQNQFSPADSEAIYSHLTNIAKVSGYILLENIVYHARLMEEPHAYTWKEYTELVEHWGSGDAAALRSLLEKRAQEKHMSIDKVARECYRAACTKYENLLGQAADDTLKTSFKEKLAAAKVQMQVIRALAIDLGYFSGSNPVLKEEDFMELLETSTKWAHFINDPEYPPLRAEEKSVLLEVVKKVAYPEIYYETMKPWSVTHGFRMNKEERELYDEVAKELEPAVCDRVIALISQDGGINSIWPREKHYGMRRALFDKKGPLHSRPDKREGLLKALGQTKEDETISKNGVELFHMLNAALQNKLDFDGETVDLLRKDDEFILAVWNAATGCPLQPRALGSLLNSRKEVIGQSELRDLPATDWIKVSGMLEEFSVSEKEQGDDGSDAA